MFTPVTSTHDSHDPTPEEPIMREIEGSWSAMRPDERRQRLRDAWTTLTTCPSCVATQPETCETHGWGTLRMEECAEWVGRVASPPDGGRKVQIQEQEVGTTGVPDTQSKSPLTVLPRGLTEDGLLALRDKYLSVDVHVFGSESTRSSMADALQEMYLCVFGRPMGEASGEGVAYGSGARCTGDDLDDSDEAACDNERLDFGLPSPFDAPSLLNVSEYTLTSGREVQRPCTEGDRAEHDSSP